MYFCFQQWKKFRNRLTTDEVIAKCSAPRFFKHSVHIRTKLHQFVIQYVFSFCLDRYTDTLTEVGNTIHASHRIAGTYLVIVVFYQSHRPVDLSIALFNLKHVQYQCSSVGVHILNSSSSNNSGVAAAF